MPSTTPSAAPRRRRVVAAIQALVTATVLTVASLLVVGPASAVPLAGPTMNTSDEGGSVSGTVRRSEDPGHPVGQGYSVSLDPSVSSTTTSYETTVNEDGRFSITGIAPGTYLIKVHAPTETYYMRGYDDLTGFHGSRSFSSEHNAYIEAGTTIDADFFVPFELYPMWLERERIGGADRYDTAARVSRHGFFDPNPLAFIASGEDFPDALSAAPAAGRFDAPLLLTARNALPASTVAELKRLQTKRAVVVGGESVVSASVVSQLKALGITVERLGGADRYATSVKVARYAFIDCNIVSIATGANFPDALAMSAVGVPLLLVNGGGSSLRSDTRQAIADLGCTDATIAGGTAVVSTGIERELRDTMSYVERFAGADRYETARKIADIGGVQRPHVFVAPGSNFPDALAAASYAARIAAPVYLAPRTCVPAASARQIEEGRVALLTLVGGESVLSGEVEFLRPC